uniref:Peptidoglycan-binding protein n=1 Tax=Geobacter metallireducens TaxID=28232 RepID=A0A831UET3_GEOME
MTNAYRRGSKGPEVKKIQARLAELGLYRGDCDGIFGGGTESSVKMFQKQNGLGVDGVVGEGTWKKLFGGGKLQKPEICKQKLEYRCLALTGTIETGRPVPDCFAMASGDFDGQGLSFGALQWNLGQGSLQPLFREMAQKHPSLLEDICHDYFPELKAIFTSDRDDQLAWVRSVQDQRRFTLFEPWKGLLTTLGRTEEFQAIQVNAAGKLFKDAKALCAEYGLWSERGVALMFDIKVQNGSISPLVKSQIMADFARLGSGLSADEAEEARLVIVANRRAEASNPRWIEDVRRRKTAIAHGEGMVHGNYLHLEDQFGIRLKPF